MSASAPSMTRARESVFRGTRFGDLAAPRPFFGISLSDFSLRITYAY